MIRHYCEDEPRIFYGLEPRFAGSRVYRVDVSPRGISAAYVAGRIYDEASARVFGAAVLLHLWICYPLFRSMARRRLARVENREAAYDSLDAWSPEFLEVDTRNFRVPRAEIAQIRFDRNRSLWLPSSAGSCELELKDGKRRRLLLISGNDHAANLQQQERLVGALASLGCPLQLKGRLASTTWLERKLCSNRNRARPSPQKRRFARNALCTITITLGGFCATLGWFQPALRAKSYAAAAFFMCVFLQALTQSHCVKAPSPQPPNSH